MKRINIRKGAIKVKRFVKKNDSLILLITSVTTSIAGAVMIAKAAPEAKKVIDEVKENAPEDMPKAKLIWEETKAVAPIMAIPAAVETLSIASSIGSYKANNKKLAVVTTALATQTSRFEEYQKKVIENFGAKKERDVRDKIISDHVKEQKALPESTKPDGKQLCFDVATQRLFWSSPGEIEKALRKTSDICRRDDGCPVNTFYYVLDNPDLPEVPLGEDSGWTPGRDHIDQFHDIEAEYSSHMTADLQTALAVEFFPKQHPQWY